MSGIGVKKLRVGEVRDSRVRGWNVGRRHAKRMQNAGVHFVALTKWFCFMRSFVGTGIKLPVMDHSLLIIDFAGTCIEFRISHKTYVIV